MQANFPLPPGSVLGLLGGGQLGRMFAQAAANMGYKVKVLEKGECPASEVSAYHIDAAYTDKKAIEELRQTTAAVTTEFENVPAEVLSALAADGACVTAPSSHAVAIAQDRIDEKTFLESVAGVPVAPHAALLSADDADSLDASLFPAILKTARMGYDGQQHRRNQGSFRRTRQPRLHSRKEAFACQRGFRNRRALAHRSDRHVSFV